MAGQTGITILCPLQIEAKALNASLRGRRCAVACCGPGAAGVQRWFAGFSGGGPVVLAGLAGGISPHVRRGEAYAVRRVVASDGRAWTPNWPGFGETASAVAASTEQAVTSPAAKRSLAKQTGADLVDMESAAFAEAACQAGLTWAIIRGISDDAAAGLPIDIDQWVDAAGATRAVQVARSVLRRPQLIGDLIRLQRASQAGLTAVGRAVQTALDSPAVSENHLN